MQSESEGWKMLKREAILLASEGRIHEAIIVLNKAIGNADLVHPFEIALLQNKLASLYIKIGEATKAELAARESIRLEQEFGDCGAETTNYADFCFLLAKSLEVQGRYTEALPWAEEAAKILSELVGTDNDLVKGVLSFRDLLRENSWRG